jgi:hypothetical protein
MKGDADPNKQDPDSQCSSRGSKYFSFKKEKDRPYWSLKVQSSKSVTESNKKEQRDHSTFTVIQRCFDSLLVASFEIFLI